MVLIGSASLHPHRLMLSCFRWLGLYPGRISEQAAHLLFSADFRWPPTEAVAGRRCLFPEMSVTTFSLAKRLMTWCRRGYRPGVAGNASRRLRAHRAGLGERRSCHSRRCSC